MSDLPPLPTGFALDDEGRAFLDRAVEAARAYLGADVGFLAEFDRGEKVIRHTAGEADAAGLPVGRRFALQGTYCSRIASGELPTVVDDARNDDRVSALPITAELGIDTYIGVPVSAANGRVFGTLCCTNFDPGRGDRAGDARFMRFLAELIGTQLNHLGDAGDARRQRVEAVQAVLRAGGPRMVFQPIVALDGGEVVGAEALARFDPGPHRTPDAWFADAWAVGLGPELELAAVRGAVAQLPQLPAGAYLAVNVSPLTLTDERFDALLDELPAGRIVVEITEHAVIDDYAPLARALKRLRAAGVRIAIDDVGAGYSGLRHVLHVAPDIAKLDMSLTRDIDTDPVKQALAAAVAVFASRTGLRVVAEGVETAAEAAMLAGIGIQCAQGYLFAKPTTLPFAG